MYLPDIKNINFILYKTTGNKGVFFFTYGLVYLTYESSRFIIGLMNSAYL